MNTTVINIQSATVDSDDIALLGNMLEQYYPSESFKLSQSKSFNGMEDIIIILSIGGGIAIKQFGNIIVNWINKDKDKKVKYKNIEVSGYSADEVSKIISKLPDRKK